MKRRLPLALLAVCGYGLTLAPAAAPASTVEVIGDNINFDAVAGEDNSLTISRDGANYRYVDTGSTITPMGTCTASAPGVICPAAGIVDLRINLGDLDDTVTIADSVTGDIEADIDGDEGGDLINGGENTVNDVIGDDSNDPASVDTINGGRFDDDLDGGPGNDVINGGGGEERFFAEPGNETYNGGAGPDRYDAGSAADGADSFVGGPGFDEVSYSSRFSAVKVTGNDQADDGFANEGDNIAAEVEFLEGGQGDDELIAGPGSNEIRGNQGDDLVDGGPGDDFDLGGNDGDDSVFGGPGDDLSISGGAGSDRLEGGAGDDIFENAVISFSSIGEPDTISGGAGIDTMDYSDAIGPVVVRLDRQPGDGVAEVDENDTVLPSVEDVIGTPFADRIVGSNAANTLIGGRGRDILIGGGGSDGLEGGDGNDTLNGGKGLDSFVGGSGADRILARARDRDAFSCGAGRDFVKGDLPTLDRPGADCERVQRPRRR